MAEIGTETRRSIRRHLLAGAGLVLVGVVGFTAWATTTEISGAVVAPGRLVTDSDVKKVQHPDGGIVAELRARNGDRVKAGDVLARLDATVTRANLAIISKGLDELTARKARLEAERDQHDRITFPDELLARTSDPEIARVVENARRLLASRRAARGGQRAQLRQRIAQLHDEVAGNEAQLRAKGQEIAHIQRELTGARDLWARNLMPITKLTALEREAARIEGERGQLVAAIAQVEGKVSETELQILQIDQDFASQVGGELREVEAKIGEYVERKVAAEDRLTRVDIRAPQSGIVHQTAIHTVGGVINAGETLMLIVPAGDSLLVEANVAPQDIDRLTLGQKATLRFSTFNQRTTPEIDGALSRISGDTTSDERTGVSYYTVRIAMPPGELARLGAVTLIPGMPVEAFIATGERNVLSYLIKPLTDQIAWTFRER
jgi:HlyD family secretion protein